MLVVGATHSSVVSTGAGRPLFPPDTKPAAAVPVPPILAFVAGGSVVSVQLVPFQSSVTERYVGPSVLPVKAIESV